MSSTGATNSAADGAYKTSCRRRSTGPDGVALAVHDLGEIGDTDARPPGHLILAEPVGIHSLPQGLRIHRGKLGGLNLDGSIQRGFHLLLEIWAHVPLAPGYLGHVPI